MWDVVCSGLDWTGLDLGRVVSASIYGLGIVFVLFVLFSNFMIELENCKWYCPSPLFSLASLPLLCLPPTLLYS